jgi:hypothetical protein
VLIAGAAAAAAGGAAVAASRGGSDAPAGLLDVSGAWHGTKTVTTDRGTPIECRRVFDEGWQISQNGSSLEIAVDTIVSDCGPQACSAGCTTGPPGFTRRHAGTVSGSTAFVYPYAPDFLTPSCALPMTLQGSTLRGSFSACMTEQPLPVAMDVVLRRVTR